MTEIVLSFPATGGMTLSTVGVQGPGGGGGGGISDGDKGDITVSGSGATWTIDAGAVSLSKMADLATSTILGRASAGTGSPEALTPAQVRTLLNVADGATANASDASLRDRSTHTGTQAGTTVSVDDSAFAVISGADAQLAFASVDDALTKARSTGIVSGGALTSLGSGVVRIAAGSGSILDNTDPDAPVYTSVTWAQTDLNLSGADGLYYVYANAAGTVQATTTEPSHAEYRTSIWLHRVSIRSAIFSASTSIAQPVQQDSPQIWDIWRALGLMKRGLMLAPASTDLTIQVGEGEVYAPGANFQANPLSPHEVAYALRSGATFRHVDQQGDQTADRTTLDVGNYDLAGTITAIPGAGTRAQIFTVKMFPNAAGNLRIFYGQQYYNSVAEARAALADGTHNPILPEVYENEAITLGWFITEKAATNLADGTQQYITSNKFGLSGGAVASTGTGGGSGDVVGPASSTDNAIARFDSTTGKLIQNSAVTVDDNGVVTVPVASVPAAPASGKLSLFARSMAGRPMLAQIGPSGAHTLLQPHLGGKRILHVAPTSGTTAPTQIGGNIGSTGGVSFQQSFASSNRWLSTARKRYAGSSTPGTAAGVRQAYLNWFRGSAAGFGGFTFRAQIGLPTNLNGSQTFIGLCTATGALGGDPSTDFPLTMCGMGWDSSDPDTGNWQFFRNDGSGSPVKVDLGATNAARAVDVGYELNMFMAPGGSELFVYIVNLNTGATVIDTSYTTDIPAVDTGMAMKCDTRNGAVSSASNIEFANIYIEADY